MIARMIQLTHPNRFQNKFVSVNTENKVLVRPEYMALCHADQRYYQGKRPAEVLKKKLPMALIHESIGRVVHDSTGRFSCNEMVVMIPNTPPKDYNYRDDEYENYVLGGKFRSSGYDGFMQEIVAMEPELIVPFENIDLQIASITEFVSVSCHAIQRTFCSNSLGRQHYAIWGDGNLAYTTAVTLKSLYPEVHLAIFGKHEGKLSFFTMADEKYLVDGIPPHYRFEHGFECVGGEGSYSAINSMIDHALPQASITLMGVSENQIPINTRDILEKGLTVLGSSRSGRKDYETALAVLSDTKVQNRLRFIIKYFGAVRNINDIQEVFDYDKANSFKTVFKWEV
jgi:ribitol-5-phosphate 2-dehydrogenase